MPAVGVLLAALGLVTLANGVPTALYATWQADFGLSDAAVTAIYASAAVGVLPVLLLVGGLSDRLGRRPAVLAGLGVVAAGTTLLLFAPGTWWLVAGRVLVGVGIGLVSGAATGALADRGGERLARLAAAATVAGIALGPLIGGLLVDFAPAPRELVFALVLAALVVNAFAVALTVDATPGVRGSLVRRVRPPARFAPIAIVAITSWSTIGLFQSLGPKVVRVELGVASTAWALVLVFAFLGASAVVQVLARGGAPALLSRAGLLALPAGAGLLVLAVVRGSVALFLAGALTAGAGQGLTNLASQALTAARAPAAGRAEAFSALLVAAYVGGSVPPLLLGLAAGGIPLGTAVIVYAGVVAVASALSYRSVASFS